MGKWDESQRVTKPCGDKARRVETEDVKKYSISFQREHRHRFGRCLPYGASRPHQ